jgi:hypothetical protein
MKKLIMAITIAGLVACGTNGEQPVVVVETIDSIVSDTIVIPFEIDSTQNVNQLLD